MVSPRKVLSILQRIKVDLFLVTALLVLIGFGLIVLYSASGQEFKMVQRQIGNAILGFIVMFVAAQISPRFYQSTAPFLFILGLLLLLAVLLFGVSSHGAQRWLNLKVIRFQPAEFLKLTVPLLVATFLASRPLPAKFLSIIIALFLTLLPALMIFKQPDLGTAILIAMSGISVIFLAGISWRIIVGAGVLLAGFLPILWIYIMHPYQRLRVLTLFNPESDALGAGYHIIQSKIAIGSGGLSGKGWLLGTQSQLEFLPEHHTDFIFAVIAEEFGFLGVLFLLSIYTIIIARGVYLSKNCDSAFGRMASGSFVLSFFTYIFVNIGMVSGILPVVGVPLPLVSYGGTSMLTLMCSFGIIMSFNLHRKSERKMKNKII